MRPKTDADACTRDTKKSSLPSSIHSTDWIHDSGPRAPAG